MAFPNLKNKYAKESLFTPEQYISYKKKLGDTFTFKTPEGVIFCYQKKLLQFVLEKHKTTEVKGFYADMYLLDETNGRVAIIGNFGIGAPIAVTLLEELIALGVKKFISIGTAGTLQKNIKIGNVVVCEKAIRDEGTSYHYLPPSKYAYADKKITLKIKESLNILKQKYSVGASWTIDAPYRETFEEAKKYQEEGILSVEMEASALFAVSQYRNVSIGAIFTISDSLADLKWNPKFHSKKTKNGLETLYKVAINVLLN